MRDLVPLVVAFSGLPAVLIAAWLARPPSAVRRGLALRMACLGIVIFLGAVGLFWAGSDAMQMRAVAIALFVIVNVIGISMLLHIRRSNERRAP